MTTRTRRLAGLMGATVLLAAGLTACTTRFGATLIRPGDPIVLTGNAVPKLLAQDPVHVVAFAWDGSAWTQVPVQVDQRDLVNPGQIYNRPASSWAKLPDGTPYKILVYTPPPPSPGYQSYATYTPSDSDPKLDANDEVVVPGHRSRQAGAGRNEPCRGHRRPPARWSRRPIRSPPTPTATCTSTPARPSPGRRRSRPASPTRSRSTRATTRAPTAWARRPTRRTTSSARTRSTSVITTPLYRQTYADRWLNDGLSVTSGGQHRGRSARPGHLPGGQRRLRPQRGHLRQQGELVALRGRVHHERQRTGAGHPFTHRRQQLHLHGADRALLSRPGGHGDRAARSWRVCPASPATTTSRPGCRA